MLNFRKKYFFMNFQDTIIWFDLGENTSLRSVLKKISYSQNPYCRKAPSFRPHRRKKAFLRDFFNFRPNFHILGQQVLTKIFTWQESSELILQNPNFDFFISCLVLDKFIFLGSITYNPDFEITTFIFCLWFWRKLIKIRLPKWENRFYHYTGSWGRRTKENVLG